MNIYMKIAIYLINISDRRIEHAVIHSCLIFVILLLCIQKKFKPILCILFIILYYKTIRIFFYVWNVYKIYTGNRLLNMNKISRKVLYDMDVIENLRDLPSYHSIILCNYPAEIPEYLVQWIIPRKICVIIIKDLEKIMVKLGADTLTVDKNNNFDTLKDCISEKIKSCSIFVYINKPQSRLHHNHLGRLRSGIFHIASKLNIPVTKMVVDRINHTSGAVFPQKFQIHVSKTEIIQDPILYMKETRLYYTKWMKKFRLSK